MAREVVLLDTSILIDHIRKPDKEKTRFYELSQDNALVISTITGFELLVGRNNKNATFTDHMLNDLTVLPFHQACMQRAVEIYHTLKMANQLIPPFDIFIAATALAYEIPVATMNTKHFNRIAALTLYKK